MTASDLLVSFPTPGVIRLESRSLFGDPDHPTCRRLVGRIARGGLLDGITVRGGRRPSAELRYNPATSAVVDVIDRLVAMLRQDDAGPSAAIAAARTDRRGVVRYARHAGAMTGWEVLHDRPGRLRVRSGWLRRRSDACRSIERAVMGVVGIDRCRARAVAGSIQVDFDPEQLGRRDVLGILDAALADAAPGGPIDRPDFEMALSTASIPVAAVAQFAAPALLPAAAALFAVTSLPLFRGVLRRLVRERRVGADLLDAVVVVGCLGTMSIFPGAVFYWCAGVGRGLADRAREDSRKMMLDGLVRRPRYARLVRDGRAVRVAADRLTAGDLVVIGGGDVVPVDGRIVSGLAMVDDQMLTAAATPAEKGVGDRVLAGTLVIGGRILVTAEATGEETAAGWIGRAVDGVARSELSWQKKGERIADEAVWPSLALGAVATVTAGPGAALAVVYRDIGTGIRMAGPLAMLGAVATAARRGIVVKRARALEAMGAIDAVVLGRPAPLEVVQGLGRRGIRHVALVPPGGDAAEVVEELRREGRRVAFVGDGIDDADVMATADLAISRAGAATIADDPADVVFLHDDPALLLDWLDVARGLRRNLGRIGPLILLPHVACVVGAFTMGFGLLASVATNNLAALAALGQAAIPMARVAQLEAERRHRLEVSRAFAAGGRLDEAIPTEWQLEGADDLDAGRTELAAAGLGVYDDDA